MNIGSLFIELGSIGGDKLGKLLSGVNKGMKEIGGTSLASKAAIIAAVYAIDRLTRSSTQMGAGYKEFAHFTGLSTKMLQEWQFAGRKVNVTNAQVEKSFINVSRAMGDMLIGKGAPEGLAILADTVGFDPSKAKDTLYVMNKMQEFATSFTGDMTVANRVMESFGLDTGMIAAMRQKAFTPAKMKRAPILSKLDIKKLAEMNAKLNEFYNNLKLSMSKLVIEFMPKVIETMDKISAGVKDIVFGFDKSSDAARGFKVVMEGIWDTVKLIVEGWKSIFAGVGKFSKMVDKKGVGGAISEAGTSAWDAIKEAGKGFLMDTPFESMVLPGMPSMAGGSGSTVDVKNNITFGSDQVDPIKIKNDLSSVIENTFRQMNQGAIK